MKLHSRVRLFVTHGLKHRLLRPWAFPSKSTGVGGHCLLQRIFPTQGSNSGLLPCRQTLYRLSHQGSIVACNNSPEMGPTASGPLAHTPQPSPHCPHCTGRVCPAPQVCLECSPSDLQRAGSSLVKFRGPFFDPLTHRILLLPPETLYCLDPLPLLFICFLSVSSY